MGSDAHSRFYSRNDGVQYAVISTTAAGDTTIVPAVTGKKIRVLSFFVSANVAINVKWKSGSTDITGLMYFADKGGGAPGQEWGIFQTAESEALVINLSAATAVGGGVSYTLIE